MNSTPAAPDDARRELARKYDAVAYASRANALSHPRHLATVATLFGLAPPPVGTCRVLEVGCNDGANLLPMAATLPGARFVGCDLSERAIATARRVAQELEIDNVTLEQRDLATLADDAEPFDYIIAHGVYSWVPPQVRDALLDLAARRLAPHGAMFVSLNVFPGCRIRQAAWEMLHQHVDGIADPKAKLDAARAFAALMAEPGGTQTESDAALQQEFRRLATQSDSALFHDDLAVPNDPVYFHEFAAHLARHELAFLAEAKLSMMTVAGLPPRMQQFVAGMDRLEREQYLDFARVVRFRQSVVCRADAAAGHGDRTSKVSAMHVAATMRLVRAAAESRAFTPEADADPNLRALRGVLEWLIQAAPRIVPVAEVESWQREHPSEGDSGARPLPALLVHACFAGEVDLYVLPPPLAPVAGPRPCASAIARWQVGHHATVTNLRHEPLRIDDLLARKLLALLDGTRTRAELATALAKLLPPAEQHQAEQRTEAYLSHFALHGLLVA